MENFKKLLKIIKNTNDTLTLKRELILKIVYFSKKPLNAQQIQTLLNENENENISLPALYASLQLFEELHVLDSLYIVAKKTKYYSIRGYVSQNYLICTTCGNIEIFSDIIMDEQIKNITKKDNFLLFNQKVMLFGLCKECNI